MDELSYLQNEPPGFVAMADLLIRVPHAAPTNDGTGTGPRSSAPAPGSAAGQSVLRAHSQVLGRASSVVAGLLEAFASRPGAAPCSPAQPLDISPLFEGTRLPAALLFLRSLYDPDMVPELLHTAAGQTDSGTDTGGGGSAGEAAPHGTDGSCRPPDLEPLFGMLRLAHRLDVPRLLARALEWVHDRRDSWYGASPAAWLQLSSELQMDELRGRVLRWVLVQLTAGPAVAAPVLERLDLPSLPPDTAAMLLDGLACASGPDGQLPATEDFLSWSGPGCLCQRAVQRAAAEAAAAALAAEAAAVDAQFADELDAQFDQAAEDWEVEFDEAEQAAEEWPLGQDVEHALAVFGAGAPAEAGAVEEQPGDWEAQQQQPADGPSEKHGLEPAGEEPSGLLQELGLDEAASEGQPEAEEPAAVGDAWAAEFQSGA